MIVVALIIFGVKNQVLQVSFKVVARDFISFLTLVSDMNLFGFDMILFGSNFNFQQLSIMLVAALTNFGVKNQVPNSSSKLLLGIWCQFPLMRLLIFYFVNHQIFMKIYHIIYLNNSLSTVPGLLYLWSHAHLLTELVKRKTICICLYTCS